MPKIKSAIRDLVEAFEFDSVPVKPARWQAMEVAHRPEAEMREMLHVNLDMKLYVRHENDLDTYAHMIEPNLPWADDHFEERVCGAPVNPGIEWANWPWGVNAEKSLGVDGMFNHNYMERYWPRTAGVVAAPTKTAKEFRYALAYTPTFTARRGIRHEYGDLESLVRDLANEPDTRQAYLPIWFPEDTGDSHKGRKPCTLGYHFIMRNGRLDVVYYLRSCDFAHHFRDDVYLTIRLLLWILERCRQINPLIWNGVQPGRMVMQITSLHMFINDFKRLYPES